MNEQATYYTQQITGSGFLTTEDQRLVSTFQSSSGFDYRQDKIELYIYSFDGSLLLEDLSYNRYKVVSEGSTSRDFISTIEINPIEDAKFYNYANGDVRLSYNFIRKITEDNELFIESISPDRTELILYSVSLIDAQLSSIANELSRDYKNSPTLPRVVLKTGRETYLQVVNIGVQQLPGRDAIKIKLYEPLPPSLRTKASLALSRIISEPVEYAVTRELIFQAPTNPALRGPNFNVEVQKTYNIPTDLLSQDDIITGSDNIIYSKIGEVGAEINVDYSDYSSFIHFSSAQERLNNFQYKLSVIKNYEAFENTELIESTFKSFDHYDRFLYFITGSNSWPKNDAIPDNPTGSNAVQFFLSQSLQAALFDATNPHRLINTIPSFLREDPNNEPYNLFIDMIGQHFDNIWLYAKGMTDRYDGDNRIDYGISKDLVADALRGLGIKLYGSSANLDTLFNAFEGEGIVTGNEDINFAISASNDNISGDSYQKEIYKRLYHNTPLLLKSKGTDRGLRALLNVFGIPKNVLDIRYYGGQNRENTPFYGPYFSTTSSLDKVRIDNTGSIYQNNLSQGTFIYQPKEVYTQDVHLMEVGFSPTDNIDRYIISQSLLGSEFSIDDYIGDPRLYDKTSYVDLNRLTESTFSGSITERYDLYDYVRLLKYYDNTLFKMIKDFTPARTNAATGLIIKPHILERNKTRSIKASFTQPEYSGSVVIGNIEGSRGIGNLEDYTPPLAASFNEVIRLPGGGSKLKNSYGEFFTGEFAQNSAAPSTPSKIITTDGNLNKNNIFKKENNVIFKFRVTLLTDEPADLDMSIGTVTHISP